MKYKFDAYGLARDMVTKRSIDSRMTTRQAAGQVGISAATLIRAEKRIAPPDMNTLLKICEWVGKSPAEYFFEAKQAQQ